MNIPFAIPVESSVGAFTLRDLFAAFALAGILACPEEFSSVEDTDEPANERVRVAYAHADAMLEARTK